MPGRSIASLHSVLDWDLTDFDRGTSHIEGTFGRLRTMAVNLTDTITGAFKKMTVGITLPFVALSAFSVKSASDAAELQSAYDQVFGNLSGMMNRWAEETGNVLGRATQTMQESAQQFQSIFSKALDPAPAAELSKEFAVLAEDLGSFKNLSSEVAREKIFAGLTGESEPLKKVGVLMNEATVKAKALELGLADVKGEVSEQNKILARAAVIREQLAAADGDVIRTSGEFANMWRSLKEEVSELTIEFGERFLPIATRVVGWARSAVQSIKDLPDGVKDAIVQFGSFLAVLGPVSLALSTLAIVLLPLFLARLSPVFFLISAVVNPIGTAVVSLWRLAGGLTGVVGGLARLLGGGGLRLFAGVLLRFFTGPIGLAITAALLFKDNIVASFSKIAEIASSRLGGKFTKLFDTLRAVILSVQIAFKDLSNSPIGDFFRKMIDLIGKAGEAYAVFAGTVLVEFLAVLLDVLTDSAEALLKFVNIVDALFRGEWAQAWDIATNGTGNAVNAIIDYVKNLFPFLRLAIELIERISGTSLGGDPQLPDFVKPFEFAGDDEQSSKIGGAPSTGTTKKVNGHGGRSGTTQAELDDRREEIRLMQALAVAREKGDFEQERALQRQIDLRDKIDGYLRAGLSIHAAHNAAEKDMLELEQARAEANAAILDSHERQIDLQLAEIRGDFEHLKNLKDEEFLEQRILFYREQEVDLINATRRANEDLVALEEARADAMSRRLADQEREHEIELARIRGDDPDHIRRLEENLRRDDRVEELREGGLSKADAESQAIREGLDRQRAHLQGTFRDTFRDGLRAAMDGKLGDFFQNWIKERSFNALSNVLDRLADGLANLVGGIGGSRGQSGGFFADLFGGLGDIFAPGGGIGGGLPGAGGGGILVNTSSVLGGSISPGFDNGGSFKIKGFPGIDQNLLSLNGNPIARVSAGEIMDVRQGNGGQISSGQGQDRGMTTNFHFHGSVTNPQEVRRSGVQAAAQLARAVSMGKRGV